MKGVNWSLLQGGFQENPESEFGGHDVISPAIHRVIIVRNKRADGAYSDERSPVLRPVAWHVLLWSR